MPPKKVPALTLWHQGWKAMLPPFMQILNEHFGDMNVWKEKLALAGNRSMGRIIFPKEENVINDSFQRWIVNSETLSAFASLIECNEEEVPQHGEDIDVYYAKLEMKKRLKEIPLYDVLFGEESPERLRKVHTHTHHTHARIHTHTRTHAHPLILIHLLAPGRLQVTFPSSPS